MTTKSELIDLVAESTGKTKADTKLAVDAVFDQIGKSLKHGQEVRIASFGVFSVQDRPERPGRNPSTGEAMTLAASKNVKFKAGKELKDSI